MDEFWTDAETAFRRTAADYFRQKADLDPSRAAAAPAEIWLDLDGASLAPDPSPARRDRLSRCVSICDEAACRDPKLGRDLLAWRAAAAPFGPLEELACRLGRLAGSALHVLEAGARAAREQGSFSSCLMACREVQERLAGLVAGAGLMRFGACRLCRLLERGENGRAVRESGRLEVIAASLLADIRSAACSLLGEPWADANLPADDGPSTDERTRI